MAGKKNHTVPQFYLKAFGEPSEGTTVWCVGKAGERRILRRKAIKGIGYEDRFYDYHDGRKHRSAEDEINTEIESPFSQGDTWQKVIGGTAKDLDQADRDAIVGLMRHFQMRSPLFRNTVDEMIRKVDSPDEPTGLAPFERQNLRIRRAFPEMARREFAQMATIKIDQLGQVDGRLVIGHSEGRIWTSTNPCSTMPCPADPRISLPLPGMKPYQLVLPLGPHAVAFFVEGRFDRDMVHMEVEPDVRRGLNRTTLGQFCLFDSIRYLIAKDFDELAIDLRWAGFEKVSESREKLVFMAIT